MVRVRVSVRELREPAPHPLLQGPLVQHVHHHALTTGAGGKHEGCIPVGSPPQLLPAEAVDQEHEGLHVARADGRMDRVEPGHCAGLLMPLLVAELVDHLTQQLDLAKACQPTEEMPAEVSLRLDGEEAAGALHLHELRHLAFAQLFVTKL